MVDAEKGKPPSILQWFQAKLEHRDGIGQTSTTQDHIPGLSDLIYQREYVGHQIGLICAQLGIDPVFVTVRARNREDSLFLRPIYSQPSPLYRYLSSHAFQRPFAISNPDQPYEGCLDLFDDGRKCGGAIFDLEKYLDWPEAADSSTQPTFNADGEPVAMSLMQRFPMLLTNIRNVEEKEVMLHQGLERFDGGESRYCLTFGRINELHGDQAKDRFTHLVAIYFGRESRLESVTDGAKQECLKLANELFDAIDDIARLDTILFETTGLGMVAKLTPLFQNWDVAPADKIAFAIERLKILLSEHLIGIDYTEEFPTLKKLAGAPNVVFAETKFIRQEMPPALKPVFQIYPKVYRNDSPIGSFLASHPKTPSVAKYQLLRYFTANHIVFEDTPDDLVPTENVLASEFQRLFDPPEKQRALISRQFKLFDDRVRRTDSFDQMRMSAAYPTHALWEFLNRDVVEASKPGRSIVSFIVEGSAFVHGEETFRRLPRGILTIESSLEDAFSDRDITALRTVLSGLATLIRSLRHANSPLSYDYAIRDTFTRDAEGRSLDHAARSLAPFLFHIIRMDGDEFHDIVGTDDHEATVLGEKERYAKDHYDWIKTYSKFGPLQLKKLSELHRKVLPRIKDKETEGRSRAEGKREKLTKLLRERLRIFIKDAPEFVKAYGELGPDLVLEFFEACPSNYVWAAYLESTAEVLADRVRKENPTFVRIGPGFSAEAVLMAAIGGELNQIVKLSSKEDLEKEYANYKEFVRFKILFAARIPQRALAFDSKGLRGQACARKLDSKSEWVVTYPRQLDEEHPQEEPLKEPQLDDEGIHDDGYGALVSDLVDGDRRIGLGTRIATALSVTAAHLKKSAGLEQAQNLSVNRRKVLTSIEDHFWSGVQLWSELTADQSTRWNLQFRAPEKYRSSTTIRDCYRFKWTDFSDAIEKFLAETRAAEDALLILVNNLGRWLSVKRRCRADRRVPYFREFSEFVHYLERWSQNLEDHDRSQPPTNKQQACRVIMHGDMNARNLAWAAGFDRFFIIDFEHTGFGLRGIDQWRLIYSLLADSYFEAFLHFDGHGAKHRGENSPRIATQLEEALLFVATTADCMDSAPPSGLLSALTKKGAPEHLTNFLSAMIAAILTTVVSKERMVSAQRSGPNPKKKEKAESTQTFKLLHRQSIDGEPWQTMAFFAALKEFEYSLRDPKESALVNLKGCLKEFRQVGQNNAKALGPAELMTAFEEAQPDLPSDERRKVSRLIFSLTAVLATIPKEAIVNVQGEQH